MASSSSLCLCLFLLLLCTSPSFSSDAYSIDLDLSELEDLDAADDSVPPLSQFPPSPDIDLDHNFDFANDDEPSSFFSDDPDVVVLSGQNFSDFVANNAFVMVEFYAPWCGHCQALAPEYAAAATQLKQQQTPVPLAKVDATAHFDLAEKYEVQGYPTLFFFIDGVPKPYNSHRTKDAIVSWVNKKIGPAVVEVTTVSDAETVLETGNTIAVAYFHNVEGPAADEFTSAARQEDDVLFYQTKNEEVARIFNVKADTQIPALVLLKNSSERVSHYDGKFERDAISQFIIAHKLPLVTSFNRDTAALIFESPIKKQILLFVDPKDHSKMFPIFEEAAKSFKGKIIFVYVDSTDEEVGKPIMEFFGVSGEKAVIVGFTIVDGQPKKFVFDDEITVENIKVFGDNFLTDKLKQFYKSEPVPDKNDGDVKIVVGNNFDDVVLNESKDVLLEIYAPWCGHCKALEPVYNKLGKALHDVDSLVIAKMDGTTNEHFRAKVDGFPTLLFFPAFNKSSDPVTVDADRTLKGLYKFLKKNAAISFTLPKANKTEGEKPKPIDGVDSAFQSKDEL